MRFVMNQLYIRARALNTTVEAWMHSLRHTMLSYSAYWGPEIITLASVLPYLHDMCDTGRGKKLQPRSCDLRFGNVHQHRERLALFSLVGLCVKISVFNMKHIVDRFAGIYCGCFDDLSLIIVVRSNAIWCQKTPSTGSPKMWWTLHKQNPIMAA